MKIALQIPVIFHKVLEKLFPELVAAPGDADLAVELGVHVAKILGAVVQVELDTN